MLWIPMFRCLATNAQVAVARPSRSFRIRAASRCPHGIPVASFGCYVPSRRRIVRWFQKPTFAPRKQDPVVLK